MMRRKTRNTLVWTLLVVTTLAVAPTLSAQPGERRGSRGGRGGGHPGAVLRELDLSEAQRDQLRSIAEQSAASGAFERLMEKRKALNDAAESGADEGAIRQLAYELGMAEGDAAVERAQMHAQMMAILTPEQQEEYKALRAERVAKMEERRKRFEERRGNRRNKNPDPF